MNHYYAKIKDIQIRFLSGDIDRETGLTMFETVLHEYGLLPQEEQLDRTITNENFLALLKMARDYQVREQQTDMQALDKIINQSMTNLVQQYRLADSIQQNCPICHGKSAGLYNRMQTGDNQTIPVDPPRCKSCMIKWVEEKFGMSTHSSIAAPPTTVSIDDSGVKPLDAAETDFFAEYEKQMDGFKL
jgi:DNA-directed RNA polymerase subunit M/transcription elongation factor TFIIS